MDFCRITLLIITGKSFRNKLLVSHPYFGLCLSFQRETESLCLCIWLCAVWSVECLTGQVKVKSEEERAKAKKKCQDE